MSSSEQARGPGEVTAAGPSAVLLVLRTVLGGVFLLAAYQKLFSGPNASQNFLEAIQAFRVVSNDGLLKFGTFAFPWTELVCGLALIWGIWTRAAGLVLALLLAFFIALLVSAIERGMAGKPCACFGNFHLICQGAVGWCKVVEDIGLLVLAVALQSYGGGRFAVGRVLGPAWD
jgi:uncharacterized membrane protein YphA (DoxX/SURF4 family)